MTDCHPVCKSCWYQFGIDQRFGSHDSNGNRSPFPCAVCGEGEHCRWLHKEWLARAGWQQQYVMPLRLRAKLEKLLS